MADPVPVAKCDVLFKIGSYGWDEPYYHAIGDGQDLPDLRAPLIALIKKRAPCCGNRVVINGYRISNVLIRRDADDKTLNYVVASDPVLAFEAAEQSVLGKPEMIKPAIEGDALNPNVCAVIRVESTNKVYHSAHFMSGLPRNVVGPAQAIQVQPGWTRAVDRLREHLANNGWLFPVLDRAGDNADRVPTSFDPTTATVTCSTTGWSTGDTVRLINFRKDKGTVRRTAVGPIVVVDANHFTFRDITALPGWHLGKKSVCHREQTVYVPITQYFPERISHRNRGRPSDAPRGRRSRASS